MVQNGCDRLLEAQAGDLLVLGLGGGLAIAVDGKGDGRGWRSGRHVIHEVGVQLARLRLRGAHDGTRDVLGEGGQGLVGGGRSHGDWGGGGS